MWQTIRSALVWLTLCVVLVLWLGAGKPPKVIGLFVVNGLAVGSLYALGGIGIVVLYRATGVLNLAAGALGMCAVMLAWQLDQMGLADPLAWSAGLVCSIVLALGYGRYIAPAMEWRDPVVKSVATLGFALMLLGVISFLFTDDPRKFSLPTDNVGVMILGLRVTATRLLVIVLSIILVVAITFALNRTRIGLQMRALVNNRRFSALIGIPILRVELVAWGLAGLLFGLTGLFFGDLVRLEPAVITFTAFQFPNGGEGFWGVGTSFAAEMRRPVIAQTDAGYLRYTIAMVALGFLLVELHRRTKPGRAWALIRTSEAAALASGVNITLYKIWAFGLSGALAGLGGGLLAGSLGLLDAATFRAPESVLFFALVVVGGARYWLGAVIAAVLFRVAPGLLNDWGVDADLALVIFGAALLHAVITAPDGLAGQIIGLFSRKAKETRT